MSKLFTRHVSVHPAAVIAAAVVFALVPRFHVPHTYTGKVQCNGIMASEAVVHVDGSVTVAVLNGAVVTIHDGAACASLDKAPHPLLDDARDE